MATGEGGVALGGESFAARVCKQTRVGREAPGKRKLRQQRTFEEVVGVVERLTGEAWAVFHDRYGDRRRDLVLWVARHCTGMTAAELGRAAGGMDYAAVTMAIRRFTNAKEHDRKLTTLASKVMAECT